MNAALLDARKDNKPAQRAGHPKALFAAGRSGLGHDLLAEVLDLLLDTLSHLETEETELDGTLVFNQLADGCIWIFDERLTRPG
jgi:hypothetical protein